MKTGLEDGPVTQDALTSRIQGAVGQLLQRIQPDLTMPERGEFPPLVVTIDNPNPDLFAGKIHLMVRGGFEPDDEMRYFDVRVETPSGQSYASVGYPFAGTKADIIEALSGQQNDPSEILKAVTDAVNVLIEADKA